MQNVPLDQTTGAGAESRCASVWPEVDGVGGGGEAFLIYGQAKLSARFPDTEFAILWAQEYGKGVSVHGFSKDTRLWGFKASDAAMQALPDGALAPRVPALVTPAVMAPELIM